MREKEGEGKVENKAGTIPAPRGAEGEDSAKTHNYTRELEDVYMHMCKYTYMCQKN